MLFSPHSRQNRHLAISFLFGIAFASLGNQIASTQNALSPKLQSSASSGAGEKKSNTEAQKAIDRANSLSATWTRDSLKQAALEYENAAALLISASDFSSASQATIKSADVYFLFGDYGEALKRYRNAETLGQKADDWRAQASALTRIARVQSMLGNNDVAHELLINALNVFKSNETNQSDSDRNAFGEALYTFADVSYSKGDFVRAREQLNRALEKFRNAPAEEARARLLLAQLFGSIGDVENAVAEINRARDLSTQVNDKIGEARALTTLGLSFSIKRDVGHATELSQQAIEIFRKAGDRQGEAVALNSLGQVYESSNQPSLAMLQYKNALRLFEEIGSPDGMSNATFKLARINNSIGQYEQALKLLERSMQWSRAAGQNRLVANSLNEIAKIYVTRKLYLLAEHQYQKIRKFYEKIGDTRGQATTLNSYTELLAQLGQIDKARTVGIEAVPLSERAGDKGILITSLYNLSRIELQKGSPDSALSLIRRSLEIIEDLRANVLSPDFRVSYFAGVKKHYDLCITILMRLEQMRPGHGSAAEALLVNERAKARLLQDLVRESRSVLDSGASKTLLDRDRELRALFRIQAQYRMDLLINKKDPAEIQQVEQELEQIRAQYQQVQAQLRERKSPEQTQVTLEQVQNALRADDTMLLEYVLSDERSYLWLVTSSSLETFELPARKVIEDTAREAYKSLTARQGNDDGGSYSDIVAAADNRWKEISSKLSEILLGPVADKIGSKRLLVVSEGALQNIPFDSLPSPKGTGSLLIEKNEVVVMPSVSTLISIRNSRLHHAQTNELLAIIADPVFSPGDERAPQNLSSRVGLPSGAKSLVRLPYTSKEADDIAAIAPGGNALVLKGFDAQRERAMSSDFARHKILHIAAHSYLDSSRPEQSGIVLSTLDRSGNPTNGFMSLHDINSLDLSSDLTVLSACQTALGQDIKGEGIMGLTHGFLSAGSNTVVASLWKVDDRATAKLMVDFYKSMLEQGMSPAAAHRSAKLKLMKEKGWDAPYYWAGFVVQGEYNNKIAIPRSSRYLVVIASISILGITIVGLFVLRNWRRFSSN